MDEKFDLHLGSGLHSLFRVLLSVIPCSIVEDEVPSWSHNMSQQCD